MAENIGNIESPKHATHSEVKHPNSTDDIRDNGRRKILVIGKTGVGKSTISNVLAGLSSKASLFPVSDGASSCSQKTSFADIFFDGDNEKPISIIDTVGFDDCEKESDAEVIAELVEMLKHKCDYVNTVLIALDGNNPRLDSTLKGMLTILQTMFGVEMWEQSLIVFTKICMDRKQKKKRLQHTGRSDEERAEEYLRHVESMFHHGKNLTAIYLDTHYDSDDDEETGHFKIGMESIYAHLCNANNLETAQVTRIQNENAFLKKAIMEREKKIEEQEKQIRISSSLPGFDSEPEKFLGEGSIGKVYKKGKYALKKIKSSSIKYKDILQVLPTLYHRKILDTITSYTEGDLVVVVTEFASDGNYQQYTAKFASDADSVLFKEWNVWRDLCQLSYGLSYLHGQNILHRNLTMENVLAVDVWSEKLKKNVTRWKLSDVAMVSVLGEEDQEELYSRAVHVPPEVVADYRRYSAISDIWSMGLMIVYRMNRAKPLFTDRQQVLNWRGLEEDTVRENVHFDTIRENVHSNTGLEEDTVRKNVYSTDLVELVGRMLHPDPDVRPTAEHIYDETYKNYRQKSPEQLKLLSNA